MMILKEVRGGNQKNWKSNELLHKEILLLKQELRSLRKNLQKEDLPTESNIEFPIDSIEKFQDFEALLSSSTDEKRHVVKKLKLVGGVQIRSVVNNLMRSVMTKEVGASFSLKGKSENKRSFENTKLFECIIGKSN